MHSARYEEIDEFWEETSKHFNIVVRRHQEYLNWRYVDHPEYRYAIYTATKDRKILGYCVLCEAQHEDQRIGFIEDVLGSQHPCNVVYQLIQWATECFGKDGVDTDVCTISEGHPYKAILRRAGFVPYPRHKRALVATMICGARA